MLRPWRGNRLRGRLRPAWRGRGRSGGGAPRIKSLSGAAAGSLDLVTQLAKLSPDLNHFASDFMQLKDDWAEDLKYNFVAGLAGALVKPRSDAFALARRQGVEGVKFGGKPFWNRLRRRAIVRQQQGRGYFDDFPPAPRSLSYRRQLSRSCVTAPVRSVSEVALRVSE